MAAIADVVLGTLFNDISSLNEQAEESAAAGEWDTVSELLAKRNALLQGNADGQSEDTLRAAIRSTARIRAMVESAQKNIGRELGTLHRGQEATQVYHSHTHLP